MEGIRPPGSINFDGNNVADAWEKFYEQFEWYLCAIGLDGASDMRKISLFLNVAGAEAQRIFGTFTFVGETEDPKKYADVINKFTNFCMPKKNLVYERYVFNICVQKEGQNVDSYVTELRHKAQTCDYGELKDSLIRDRIVVGINSTQLKEKMLQDKDLSLESAISRCKSAEMTQRQMQVIQEKGSAYGGKETEPVNVIKHGRKGNRKSQINNAHPETFDCNKCGKNHQHKKCPAYSAVCHKCKKKGHYKQFCLKPVHVVSLESNKDSVFCGLVKTEKSVKVSAINDKKWTHPLNIDGNIVVVKIDTGAGADLLSYGDFLSLQRKPSLKPTKTRLSDYNDNAIDVKGSCVLRVAMHDRQYPVRFIVVENGPSLLGCDTSERLNLVQRVYNVNVKECVLPETNTILNCLPFQHTIQLKADAVPVIHASRRVAATLREPLKKELSRMEKLGVIHKVDHPTEWVNSMVITEKPNGDLRICLDPKDLNRNILREHYPLPKKEEIFAEMCGAKWFSKLDASQAFWQIKLCDKSKDYTTFNTPFGRWAYDRLPYGVCSAPEVFHKVMEQMMENINGVRVYMDDILVWGHTEKEHDEHLEAVRDRIRKYGLMMNQEKCVVKKNAITFLGEELSVEGITPSQDRISAILKMNSPQNKEEVQRLLGLVNYVGKYVDNLSYRTKHMRTLLCKKTAWCWNHEHENEWQNLKKLLIDRPVLAYYDVNLKTKVSTDSCKDSLGACLLQLHDGVNWKPVAYAARSMTSAEKNYAMIEKELLGLVWGCGKFHEYIYGLDIVLETDHKPIVALSNKGLNDMSPRLQRLMMRLQKYNFTVEWIPGKDLVIPDTLSRASFNINCIDTELSDIVDTHVDLVIKSFPATDKQLIRFANETLKDPILYAAKNCILHGWKNGQCPAYASFKDELCVINGIIFKGSRIVVPVSMRNEMLCRIHEGHLGQDKQKSMARSVLYWPNMNVHIEEMSNKCAVCQMYKPAQCKESYHTDDDITGPWNKVATDCFHFRGHDYLLLVDYYSNYPEIAKLASLSSSNVILHMKSIFARHGIPRVLVSDNATCYASRSFKMFADEFNFEHRTSSPGYPQSNGKAEKSVGIVKGVLNKALDSNDDIYLALLAYRTAPMACGKSPSEMLMNRKLRNRLPQVDSESIEINERQIKRKQKQVELYNQHAKDLPVLKPNDVVRVRKDDRWANKAQVLVQISPRSYKVLTKEGKVIRRNRRQLLRTDEPMNSSDLRDTCNIDVEHSMSNSSENTEHISEEASKSDNEGTSDRVSETSNDVVVRTSRGGLQSSGHTQDVITEQPPEVQTRRSSRVTGKPVRYGNNSYD